jgi:hypothetical protein
MYFMLFNGVAEGRIKQCGKNAFSNILIVARAIVSRWYGM